MLELILTGRQLGLDYGVDVKHCGVKIKRPIWDRCSMVSLFQLHIIRDTEPAQLSKPFLVLGASQIYRINVDFLELALPLIQYVPLPDLS